VRFRYILVRASALVLAAIIVTASLTCVGNAAQSYTVANAAITSYNLASGASSAAIKPATSQPILVMGCCTTVGFRGVGYVNMLHVPSSFLEWEGQNSTGTGNGTIVQGFSSAPGTSIVHIDFSNLVQLEVLNADSFVVHNLSGSGRTGNVTMIW
jgi:hypothetical protein